jgi:hypothetical protein
MSSEDGITVRKSLQITSATKSANRCHMRRSNMRRLLNHLIGARE